MKTILGLIVLVIVVFLYFGTRKTMQDADNRVKQESSTEPKYVAIRSSKLDFKWHKGGFESVMIADFTVTNPTAYAFKDFTIKCTHSAPSGTVIDSNTQTIYQIVPAKSTKRFKDVNMGFIHSQAARSGCEITDLVVQ